MTASKSNVLLHVCCGPCSTHCIEVLRRNWHPLLYWTNANIFPQTEYDRRLHWAYHVSQHYGLELIVDTWDHDAWLERVSGLEEAPEGGRRCATCFGFSFDRAAAHASRLGISTFTSTLSISPHKDKDILDRTGHRAASAHAIAYLSENFRDGGGYGRSIALSRQLGLYRQRYCGCEFSGSPQDGATKRNRKVNGCNS